MYRSFQVLGLNGYEHLLEVSSGMLTNKVVQLLGQKYNVQSKAAVKKEIILVVCISVSTTARLLPLH